jgi:ferric hydroxamate transport system substrate-binding protein
MSADLCLNRRHMMAGAASLFAFAPNVLASNGLASSPPRRVVCLDYGLASTLLAFGFKPLAVSSLADWDKWVEEPSMPEGVIDLGSSWEINFELLLALKPDLILSTAFNDLLNPRLKTIAPLFRATVYVANGGNILPRAYQATRDLGRIMQMQDQAEALLTKADALFEACRTRLSRINGQPLAMVGFLDARHVRIFTAPGLFDDVLRRLGLRNAWEAPGNYWGFETMGIENLSKITDPKARLITFEPLPADVLPTLAQSPLWQALPMMRPHTLGTRTSETRTDRFGILPSTLMFGLVVEAMRFASLLTDYLDPQA